MDGKKESLFKLLDEMIDRGIDVLNLRQELPKRNYDSVRKRFVRTFGSYNQALVEYGFYSTNGTPSEVEIARCFEITDKYEVVTNKHQKARICDLYFLSDTEFARVSKSVVYALWTDAIDELYRDHFPFDKLSVQSLEKEYPHLRRKILTRYGTFKDMLTAYGTPYDKFVNRDCGSRSAKHGNEFERKLAVILRVIYGGQNVDSSARIGNCRPDFVLHGRRWVDAKLSRYTIYDKRCDTLRKYREHTDTLTIYFARGERGPLDIPGAKLRHVSALYPLIKRAGRSDLIDDMETFVTAVEGDMRFWRDADEDTRNSDAI